jgi:uncharacterized protein YqhQ
MASSEELHASPNGDRPQGSVVRLGGMALRNGLLVHGPTHWAVAVRDTDGRVRIDSGPKPRIRGPLAELPGIRGVARLAEAFALLPLIRRQVPQARLPFEDRRALAAMVSSSALSALVRRGGRRSASTEAVVAMLGIAPAALALKDSDLAAYHGVEHKAIGAYEHGTDISNTPKEHDRCGSNLITPMLLTTVAGNLIARAVLNARGPLVSIGVTLASVATSVEMFAWSERHSETPLARAFRRPGFEMQRLFATREPSPEQLEIGTAAMDEILRLELRA